MFRLIRQGEELPLDMPSPAVELFEVRDLGPSLGPMARHVTTPQLLAAMDGGRWGLWLAPAGETPASPSWHTFDHDVAVLLDPGTWHRGPVPLDAASGRFLTVERPHTNTVDFEEMEPSEAPPPSDEAFAAIAAALGAEMVGRRPLLGGVSANVEALTLRYPDGSSADVVVRAHGAAAWKPLGRGITALEHALLTVLADQGMAVPRPLHLDLSSTILPEPYLVLPFMPGSTGVEDLHEAARFLATLHGLDPSTLPIPEDLPTRTDPITEMRTWLSEEFQPLATDLRQPPPIRPSILHGDFWYGNILWQDGRISAVIDWEDAAVGDPTSDVAVARIELLWSQGPEAVDAFTRAYETATGGVIEPHRLALWDLYVTSAGLKFMGSWGLEPEDEATRRAKSQGFIRRAFEVLHG